MTVLWRRETRKVESAQPRQMASATPGIPFEATITAWWRPRRSRHLNVEDLVRYDVTTAAAEVARHLEANDLPFAQDAINAALGTPPSAKAVHYRLIQVDVLLGLSPASRESLAQRRADAERVRRLRFLKEHLYDDPALVVLDQMEHHPERLKSDEVEYIQRLARSLRANESWWRPLFEQWQVLGEGFSDIEMQHRAMRALRKSLEELKER